MMRKTKIFLVILAAFLFAITPAAMADTTSDTVEADHSDYGMDEWISDFDHNPEIPGYDGIQVEGDGAYGYYTGWNPGFNGIGEGLIDAGLMDGPLGAPSYTIPCPDFAGQSGDWDSDGYDENCEANVDSDEPQTKPSSEPDYGGTWEIPILDDVLAKMWDYRSVNDRLTQQLDILFFLDPSGKFTGTIAGNDANYEGFIDQTLDQDLADYQGNISSYVASNGIGHTQRLTQIFQTATTDLSKDTPGAINASGGMMDANFIDQWLLSYTKDIVGHGGPKKGIVSSYSSWFMLDKDKLNLCDNGTCEYTYDTSHDSITKTVPEIDDHPNDDIPDP